VLVPPGLGRPNPSLDAGSLEKRSDWLGRALARRLDSQALHPLDWILGGPVLENSTDPFSGRDLRCRPWLETLFARCENASRLETSRLPVAASGPRPSTFAALLDWAWHQTDGWDPVVREACLLQPLMPLYLSAAMPAEGRLELQTIVETQLTKLALELIGLIELSRSLESVGFTSWVKERINEGQDPRRLIQEGLTVDLSRMANAIGEMRCGSGCPSWKLSPDAESQSELLDDQWWSLAWQWSHHPESLLVPQNIPGVVVPWTESISHWKAIFETLKESHAPLPKRFLEVRALSDPFLFEKLEQLLEEIRSDQTVMTMVLIRYVGEIESITNISHKPLQLSGWQTDFLKSAGQSIEGIDPIGYVSAEGDLGLLYRDLDRNELAQCVRELLASMRTFFALQGQVLGGQNVPLIVGIASVDSPTRSFRINRLQDAANRCLENAASQGPGSIKSIEVF
jgi:hypothetical protein